MLSDVIEICCTRTGKTKRFDHQRGEFRPRYALVWLECTVRITADRAALTQLLNVAVRPVSFNIVQRRQFSRTQQVCGNFSKYGKLGEVIHGCRDLIAVHRSSYPYPFGCAGIIVVNRRFSAFGNLGRIERQRDHHRLGECIGRPAANGEFERSTNCGQRERRHRRTRNLRYAYLHLRASVQSPGRYFHRRP
ncbi:hypothetical protein D3C81_976230 [compost metagenome]